MNHEPRVMLEIAHNFERAAANFRPVVLIALGLAAVTVGLFVWLGGLGFRKILAAVVGAVGGGIGGFFITGRNITLAMVLAAAVMIIAIILERILVTGSLFWHLISALFCAAIGAALVFVGMILLLLYKGAAPVSCINNRQSFYLGVFTAMIAFGTIEQLLFCQHPKKKPIVRKETNKGKKSQGEQR